MDLYTNLSPHFKLREFVESSTATRLGIDNTPTDEVIQNLTVVALGLEKVRQVLSLFNTPIFIDSGYRCPELNKAVHGSPTSAHVLGWAADFICPRYGTPLEIAKTLVTSPLQFDQLIMEGTWLHISFDPKMRRQVLTATFINGKPTYTLGLPS